VNPLLPALVVVALATCGNPQRGPETPEAIVRAMPDPARILDLRHGGEEIGEAAMLSDLRAARAIFLGERHDDPLDHGMQYRILRALHRDDGMLHVGMEMFERPFQPVLDDWVAGRLDEEGLRRRTEWDERWGYDIRLYRPLLELARSRAIPLWALNAPRELVGAVAHNGLEDLDEPLRAQLPELVLDDREHRALFMEAMREGHPHADGPEALERLYQAQLVRDETMAETVVRALDAGASRVVVLAGALHVRGGHGVPEGVRRRRPSSSYRIVLAVKDDDEEALEELLHAQPRPADYLWVHD